MGSQMRVLNICVDDHANFMHENAKALRSVGIDCHDYKLQKHVFGYEVESEVKSENEISELIKQFDLIQIFHSEDRFLGSCKGKRTVVWHTGTTYRQNPNGYNVVFNPNVEMCFLALPEFVGLGAKNGTYIVGAVDTDKLIQINKDNYVKTDKVKVAHYPSNPKVKGTVVINEVIEELLAEGLDFEYLHSTNLVAHPDQLKRIAKCDIYIELFAPMQGDKKYGSFGITALESMAMDKCVISMGNNGIYQNAYKNDCAIFLVETKQQLKEEIKAMVSYFKYNELGSSMSKVNCGLWAVKNHSYVATGEYIKNKLGI